METNLIKKEKNEKDTTNTNNTTPNIDDLTQLNSTLLQQLRDVQKLITDSTTITNETLKKLAPIHQSIDQAKTTQRSTFAPLSDKLTVVDFGNTARWLQIDTKEIKFQNIPQSKAISNYTIAVLGSKTFLRMELRDIFTSSWTGGYGLSNRLTSSNFYNTWLTTPVNQLIGMVPGLQTESSLNLYYIYPLISTLCITHYYPNTQHRITLDTPESFFYFCYYRITGAFPLDTDANLEITIDDISLQAPSLKILTTKVILHFLGASATNPAGIFGWGWLLLLLSGDVELNPGPSFSVITLQAQYNAMPSSCAVSECADLLSSPSQPFYSKDISFQLYGLKDNLIDVKRFHALGAILASSINVPSKFISDTLLPAYQDLTTATSKNKHAHGPETHKSPSQKEHSNKRRDKYKEMIAEVKTAISSSFAETADYDLGSDSCIPKELMKTLPLVINPVLSTPLPMKVEMDGEDESIKENWVYVFANFAWIPENLRALEEESKKINKEMHATNGNIDSKHGTTLDVVSSKYIRGDATVGTADKDEWKEYALGWARPVSKVFNIRDDLFSQIAFSRIQTSEPNTINSHLKEDHRGAFTFPTLHGVMGAARDALLVVDRGDVGSDIIGLNVQGKVDPGIADKVQAGLAKETEMRRSLGGMRRWDVNGDKIFEMAKKLGMNDKNDILGNSHHRIVMMILIGYLYQRLIRDRMVREYQVLTGQAGVATTIFKPDAGDRTFTVAFMTRDLYNKWLNQEVQRQPNMDASNTYRYERLWGWHQQGELAIIIKKRSTGFVKLQRRILARCKWDQVYINVNTVAAGNPDYSSPNYCLDDTFGYTHFLVVVDNVTANGTGNVINGSAVPAPLIPTLNVAANANIPFAQNVVPEFTGTFLSNNIDAIVQPFSWESSSMIFANNAIITAALASVAAITAVTAPSDGIGNIAMSGPGAVVPQNQIASISGVAWETGNTISFSNDIDAAQDFLAQTTMLVGNSVVLRQVLAKGMDTFSLVMKAQNLISTSYSMGYALDGSDSALLASGAYDKETLGTWVEGYLAQTFGCTFPHEVISPKNNSEIRVRTRAGVAFTGLSPVPIYKPIISMLRTNRYTMAKKQVDHSDFDPGDCWNITAATDVVLNNTIQWDFKLNYSMSTDQKAIDTLSNIMSTDNILNPMRYNGAAIANVIPNNIWTFMPGWNMFAQGQGEIPSLLLTQISPLPLSSTLSLGNTAFLMAHDTSVNADFYFFTFPVEKKLPVSGFRSINKFPAGKQPPKLGPGGYKPNTALGLQDGRTQDGQGQIPNITG